MDTRSQARKEPALKGVHDTLLGRGNKGAEGSHFSSSQPHKALTSPTPTAATVLQPGQPGRLVLPSLTAGPAPRRPRPQRLGKWVSVVPISPLTEVEKKTMRGEREKKASDCTDGRRWERHTLQRGPGSWLCASSSRSPGPGIELCPQWRRSTPTPPTLLTDADPPLWHHPQRSTRLPPSQQPSRASFQSALVWACWQITLRRLSLKD